MVHAWIAVVVAGVLLAGCLRPSDGHRAKKPHDESQEEAEEPGNDDQFELLNPIAHGLRGYEEVQQIVQQRLLKDPNFRYPLINLVEPDPAVPDLFSAEKSFIALLGAFTGGGLRQDYQGRDPNALNMLLWLTLYNLLAKEIVSGCDVPQASPFNIRILEPVCAMKNGDLNIALLDQIWISIMANDAPVGERLLWRGEILESFDKTLETENRDVAVREVLVEVLMNPYFMIARR